MPIGNWMKDGLLGLEDEIDEFAGNKGHGRRKIDGNRQAKFDQALIGSIWNHGSAEGFHLDADLNDLGDSRFASGRAGANLDGHADLRLDAHWLAHVTNDLI